MQMFCKTRRDHVMIGLSQWLDYANPQLIVRPGTVLLEDLIILLRGMTPLSRREVPWGP